MILDRVTIHNYRCFKSLDAQLHPQLNVFVGGNGAGKTTLLDAIAVLLAPIIARLPWERRPRVPGINPQDIRLIDEDRSEAFAFLQAAAHVQHFDSVRSFAWDRIKLRDSTKMTKAQSPRGRRDTRPIYAYVDGLIDAHNRGEFFRLPVFAYYSTNRAVDVPHNRMRRRELPKTFRRLVGLENALETKTDFRRAVAWFDLLEQRELRGLRDNEPLEAVNSIEAVRKAIERMIPQLKNPRIDGKTGRFAVNASDPTGKRIRLHLDQLSDGYQAMLGVVMDFALRLAIANPSKSSPDEVLAASAILIVDEVDLHLHPSWQQRVIPDLRRVFPNTQLILTTHSPQVATTVPSESLRILKETELFAAPAGTEGAEAERMLEDVFQVKPRPDLPPAQKLSRYLQLVDEKEWDSVEARDLRTELDNWSQGEEPMLVEADLRIDNMRWEQGE